MKKTMRKSNSWAFSGVFDCGFYFLMFVFIGVLAICLTTSVSENAYAERLYSSPGTAYFTDVDANSWYAKEGVLTKMYERDIMKGYDSTNLFGPQDKATRAQAVTAIYRMITGGDSGKLTFSRLNYEANKTSLEDVADNAFYTAAVNWAYSQGIVEGKDGNRFDPNAAITREELIALIGRSVEDIDFSEVADLDRGKPAVLDSNEKDGSQEKTILEFSGVSPFALPYIEWAHSIGIINPDSTALRESLYPDGSIPSKTAVLSYRPGDEATRIEMAAMLVRLDDIMLDLPRSV